MNDNGYAIIKRLTWRGPLYFVGFHSFYGRSVWSVEEYRAMRFDSVYDALVFAFDRLLDDPVADHVRFEERELW